VDECKLPFPDLCVETELHDLSAAAGTSSAVEGRGLHSSTFQLNLSALYGIGGARNRGWAARVKGVLGDV